MLLEFRAWSNFEKKYLNPTSIYLANGYVDSDECGVFEDSEDGLWDVKYLMVIEHSTKLKDKNGKIIFEGDIVDNGNAKSEVVFKDGAFRFKYNNQPIYGWLSSELEIVGNVHDGEKNEI